MIWRGLDEGFSKRVRFSGLILLFSFVVCGGKVFVKGFDGGIG